MLRAAFVTGVAIVAGACASPSAPRGDVVWDAEVIWRGEGTVERIRTGRPDASDPRPQIVGVDQAGTVVLIRYAPGASESEVLMRHPSELTGLAIADVDPDVPGEEVYVGGAVRGDEGGTVTQIVVGAGGPRLRRVFTGTGYVHAIETFADGSAPLRLVVSTYSGEIQLLTPVAGDGAWTSELLHREPPSPDPESPKFKDLCVLRDPADGRAQVLAVAKTGRAVLIDVTRPGSGRLVHSEPGGLSRVRADGTGGAHLAGYAGRVLHLARKGDGFEARAMDHEGADSGLRGFVAGRFPVRDGEVAPFAVFGFHRLVRTLTPRNGAWDATTIFRDDERGHALTAADVVPGNDADELLVGGYARRIVLLVARAR